VGAAHDLALRSWIERRTYSANSYDVGSLVDKKPATVSVILPSHTVAPTLGRVLDALVPLYQVGLVDELVVVDADSEDGTAQIARERDVTVVQRNEIMPELGPSKGKGDGLWRALSVTSGDIVVLMDTDTQNFGAHFLVGLLGPLFEDPSLQLVKGAFHRPLSLGDLKVETEGGRVTELVARPLINLFAPQLAGFRQPLAGEVAARRELLEAIPFPVGYGVDIAILIDALNAVGLDALAQVDLGTREDRNKPLRELSAMAYAVAYAVISRVADDSLLERVDPGRLVLARPDGMEQRHVELEERPPLASLRSATGERT
jgi:glucosyl-3-phosphoglycerate synthase